MLRLDGWEYEEEKICIFDSIDFTSILRARKYRYTFKKMGTI
jgi:hypothetical protein